MTLFCLDSFLLSLKIEILFSSWSNFYRFGVVFAVIVSPKEVELQIFSQGISNDCESSLSETSVITWLQVL